MDVSNRVIVFIIFHVLKESPYLSIVFIEFLYRSLDTKIRKTIPASA